MAEAEAEVYANGERRLTVATRRPGVGRGRGAADIEAAVAAAGYRDGDRPQRPRDLVLALYPRPGRQTAFAAASRAARRWPRSLSGGKNRAGSASRQAAANCPSARQPDRTTGRDPSWRRLSSGG